MKKSITIYLLTFTGFLAWNQTVWSVTSYSIKFSIDHALGATAEGKFSELSCTMLFAPKALDKSSMEATVASHTFYTGNATRDRNIKDEKYLNVAKFPTISMKSTKFVANETGYLGTFDLQIKGLTKKVTLPFTFTENGDKAVFQGSFNVNRLDFNVGESSVMLGDVLEVKVLLNAIKK